MTKYLIFKGSQYYPYGGAEDFHSRHETLEEAVKEIESYYENTREDYVNDWFHIAESSSMQVIKSGTCEKRGGDNCTYEFEWDDV